MLLQNNEKILENDNFKLIIQRMIDLLHQSQINELDFYEIISIHNLLKNYSLLRTKKKLEIDLGKLEDKAIE